MARKLGLKYLFWILIILVLFNRCSIKAPSTDYTQFVNPFIGTSGKGHTFPGATWPFGLIQLSPHTGNYTWDYTSGYQYADTTLRGFAHTHLSGGGSPVLGDVLMLPYSDQRALERQHVVFSKSEETASPGYYAARLTEDNITVELTVTERTGIQRYTFHNGGSCHVLINISEILAGGHPGRLRVKNTSLVAEDNVSISGYYQTIVKKTDRKVFFVVRFSRPFTSAQFLDYLEHTITVDYELEPDEVIEARISISTVSVESAKKNLEMENIGRSFEEIRIDAGREWNKYLSKIKIDGTPDQKVLFYTSLYHMFIQPNSIADAEGSYRGADDSLYSVSGDDMYSTFAFWDIYRAAYPLYTILIPEKIGPFISSILRHYDEKGFLPVWPLWGYDSYIMIGNHSVPVIVESYLKGFEGIDEEKAFEAIKATLTNNYKLELWPNIKYDWSVYNKYGYLPSDKVNGEAVSRTLEACYDDWCAAKMAEALGKEEDAAFFYKRAGYYKNLFDTTTQFMRGKNSDGNWVEPFDPLNVCHVWSSGGDYTEANAWQYLWYVQHDVEGLIGLFGGKKAFTAKLDTLFSLLPEIKGSGSINDVSGMIGQYAHGNEPSQHVIYLYNYAGQPHKTQEKVRQVLQTMYKNSPDGLCGNDDFGQMSAWYVLSSMGLYPVDPVSGNFNIGAPLHKYASLQVVDDKEFVIRAENLSEENKYVGSVKLNGVLIHDYMISYDEIIQGGELIFEMTNTFIK